MILIHTKIATNTTITFKIFVYQAEFSIRSSTTEVVGIYRLDVLPVVLPTSQH